MTVMIFGLLSLTIGLHFLHKNVISLILQNDPIKSETTLVQSAICIIWRKSWMKNRSVLWLLYYGPRQLWSLWSLAAIFWQMAVLGQSWPALNIKCFNPLVRFSLSLSIRCCWRILVRNFPSSYAFLNIYQTQCCRGCYTNSIVSN